MRLVAWNSCRKFATNFVHLRNLDFDVAVVSECSRIETDAFQSRPLTSGFVEPFPGSPKLLGVLAQDPWHVSAHPAIPPGPGLLPMAVAGPTSYTLLGFWGLDPAQFGSYTAQLLGVVTDVLPGIEGPVVIAGDFNAPIATSARAHAENVRLLGAHGLVSAYTRTRPLGADLEPTYYQYLQEDKPFHIDHVFVPEQWVGRSRLRVGTHQDWVASRRSDHVPLVLDVDELVPD